MTLEKKNNSRCLHHRISSTSRTSPGAVAVVYEDSSLTYQELEDRASSLACQLHLLGVGPESLVPLCVGRSLEMIVGLYGIMKAGAAYVPIDPNFPQTRIDFILKDIGSSIAVSNHEHMEKIQSTEHILNLDGLPEPGEEQIDFDSNDAKPHNLVYVIYTSGSTGMPKGTCIEHRNIISYLDAICERFSFNSPLSHAMASSLAADACKGPIFCALTTGGSVHILSHEQTTNSRRFVDYIEKYKPDTLKIVPSLLATLQGNLIADKILPQQLLILGGESSRSEWVLNWKNAANDCLIYNHYGPTETTVGVATYKTSSEIPITTSNSLPIGTALSNTELHIVDSNLKPVADGTPGELIIGGEFVGRGYWKRPEKTAECFIPDPFYENKDARCYRSGDRCQKLEDGSIEFLGRIDDQVKIRGNRVELGEIQTAIQNQNSVRACVVVTRPDAYQSNQLIAYIVTTTEGDIEEITIRSQLEKHLPDYMVPAIFVFLEKMPLTPNGKIDRQALPPPEKADRHQNNTSTKFETETEKKLAQFWEELLSSGPVSLEDNFIGLGGHSLLAVRLITLIDEAFSVDVSIGDIFKHSNLQRFAHFVDEVKDRSRISRTESIPRFDRTGTLKLSSIQEHILLECIRNPDRPTYNEISTIHLGASVNETRLENAWGCPKSC